jgi:hypothetical protein
MPGEADLIKEYTCPNCDRESHLNRANSHELTEKNNNLIRNILQQLRVISSVSFLAILRSKAFSIAGTRIKVVMDYDNNW